MAREEMVKKGGPGLRELAPTARGSQRSSEVSARILKTHNGTFLRDSFEWQSRALLSSFTVAGQSEERNAACISGAFETARRRRDLHLPRHPMSRLWHGQGEIQVSTLEAEFHIFRNFLLVPLPPMSVCL